MLNQVDAHRHGGAVIVVPTAYKEQMRVLGARYRFSTKSQFLRQRVLETLRTYQDHAESLDSAGSATDHMFKSTFSRMADEAHLVGDLSGSDGAIILGTDLELIGAGAQLPTNTISDRIVLKVQLGYLEEYLAGETSHATPALGDHIGMRHRSALSFVLQNPDAVAFVMSQDGGITVICRPIIDDEGNRHDDVMVILGVRVWAAHLANT